MKKTVIVIFLLLIWTSFVVEAGERPCAETGASVFMPQGFGTGSTYLKMTAIQKSAYAMGVLDGMVLAPFFGASEKCRKWLLDYTKGMTDEQVAAIITKFLNDNPGRWHEPLSILAYTAINDAYNKEYRQPER